MFKKMKKYHYLGSFILAIVASTEIVFAAGLASGSVISIIVDLFKWLLIIFAFIEVVIFMISCAIYKLFNKTKINYRASAIVLDIFFVIMILLSAFSIYLSIENFLENGIDQFSLIWFICSLSIVMFYVILIVKSTKTKIESFLKLLVYSILTYMPLIILMLIFMFFIQQSKNINF